MRGEVAQKKVGDMKILRWISDALSVHLPLIFSLIGFAESPSIALMFVTAYHTVQISMNCQLLWLKNFFRR